jgi:ribokinase
MQRPKITVIGSSNTDLVAKTPKLPAPGETVLGSEFIIAPGGKGANQAVAIARLGGDVTFVAKLGMDDFGDQALENFKRDGINTDFVFRDKEASSGVALIFVDDDGENMIIAVQGANARLSPADIDRARPAVENADAVVLQLETPIETVEHAVAIAAESGVPVILNPAPARKLETRLIEKLDCLTPNETEAEILTGIKVTDDTSARKAGQRLLELGASSVVVTMGKRGAMLITAEESLLVPAFQVNAVDATAAGDAFTGGLAYARASGRDLEAAVKFANAVAALAVTKMGAQPSMPAREDVERFLATRIL